MTEDDYRRYVKAFNSRDYDALMAFFTDDVKLEVAGYAMRGKQGIRDFYRFFHDYCRETVNLKRFYESDEAAVADVVIRFEGLKDLTPELLREHATDRMTPVPKGGVAEVEFFIMYHLTPEGLIHHIRATTFEPAD